MPDVGPVYVETDMSRTVVEPFNALSAMLFLAIFAYWTVRLWGRWRKYPFLVGCLPLMLIGGVGGTVYHAFRGHRAWLFMDWVPIVILCFATSIFLWTRVLKRWWAVVIIFPLVFGIQFAGFNLARAGWFPFRHMITVSYTMMATIIALPAAVVLWRTRGLAWGWVSAAVVAFLLAIWSRSADASAVAGEANSPGDWLPMGTHFLWHVFGAVAAWLASMYVYRVESLPRRLTVTPGQAPEPALQRA